VWRCKWCVGGCRLGAGEGRGTVAGLSQGGWEGLRRRARGAREEKRRRSRVGTTKKWVGKRRRRADAREGGRTGGEGGRDSASHKVRTSFCVHFILFRSRDSTSRPGPREQACYPRGTWQSTTVLLPCTACLLEKKNSSTPPDQVKAKHTRTQRVTNPTRQPESHH
jgi:hypothetical protein